MPEVQNVSTRHQAPPPPGRRAWRIVFVLFGVFAVVMLLQVLRLRRRQRAAPWGAASARS